MEPPDRPSLWKITRCSLASFQRRFRRSFWTQAAFVYGRFQLSVGGLCFTAACVNAHSLTVYEEAGPGFPRAPWLLCRARRLVGAGGGGGQRPLLQESWSSPETSSTWVVHVSADGESESVKAATQDFRSPLTPLWELRSQRWEGTCQPGQNKSALLGVQCKGRG